MKHGDVVFSNQLITEPTGTWVQITATHTPTGLEGYGDDEQEAYSSLYRKVNR